MEPRDVNARCHSSRTMRVIQNSEYNYELESYTENSKQQWDQNSARNKKN